MTRSRRRKLLQDARRMGVRIAAQAPVVSLILAGVSTAMAEDQTTSGSVLEEIVVTATKREESLQKVPESLEVIGQQKLEELQVQGLADYAQYLTSVSIGSGGSGVIPGGAGNWRVMMRGVSSDTQVSYASSLPTVGTYLDEQPITTVTGAVDVHMYDIARVEALAGPQGTLYGASSEAGTLRIITNKPDPTAFHADYNVRGDTMTDGGSGYTAEGVVNLPITTMAAVRVVGWDEHDPGYINNIDGTRTYPSSGICTANYAPAPAGCTTAHSVAEKHFNDTDTYGARAALGINLNENWTITPMFMGQDTRTQGVFGFDQSLGAYNVERFQPDNSDDRFWDAMLTIHGKISDFDLTYAGSYMRRDDTIHTDYSDYSLAYDVASGFGNAVTNNAGQLINPAQELTSDIRYFKQSHELRVTTPSDKPVRAIVGAFWQRQVNDVQANFNIDGLAAASSVTGFPDTWWLSTYKRVDEDVAEFGEVAWDVLPNLTLTGGLRLSESRNSLAGFAGTVGFEPGCIGPGKPNGINEPCSTFEGVMQESSHTPKVNLAYRIDSDRMVYATYSEGFRPGGLNRTPGVPPYLADYLKNYEVGWKTTWFDHRLRWNGAIFREDWNDFQFAFQGPNGLIQIANGGQARIKGIESELSWAAGGGLTLSNAFTLLDPELTENYCGALGSNGQPITQCTTTANPVTGALLQAPAGTQLPLTNRFKGNLQARYEFPVRNWSAHLQGTYVYQTSARVDLRDQENTMLGGDVGGYGTANFTAGMSRSNYSLELFVNNAFNKLALVNRYTECQVGVCGNPAVRPGVGGLIYDVPIQPRLIGLQFSQKF